MTDALQKLAALDKAASPGPWRAYLAKWSAASGPSEIPTLVGALDHSGMEVEFENEADAQLAALSHLLLPAFEALAECYKLIQEDGEAASASEQPSISEWANAQESARAVLAQLEEVLVSTLEA